MPDEKTGPVLSTRDLHFANLVSELERDPKYGTILRALVADKFPKESAGEFPDVEARRVVAPIVKKLEETQAAIVKERADAKAATEYTAWRASLVTAGIPESALDDVEKIARERNNADPTALALYWNSTQKPAQPTTRGWGVAIPGRNKAGGEWFNSDGQGGPGIMQDRQSWTINRAQEVWEETAAASR